MTIERIILLSIAALAFYFLVGASCYNIGFKLGHRAGFCRGYDSGVANGIIAAWKARSTHARGKDGRYVTPPQPTPANVEPAGRALSDMEGAP